MRTLEPIRGQLVVCAPLSLPAFFQNDLEGVCSVCGEPVRYRPYTPIPCTLICLLCYLVRAEPGDGFRLLGEAKEELAALGPEVPKC
jgi:hypothetical protein